VIGIASSKKGWKSRAILLAVAMLLGLGASLETFDKSNASADLIVGVARWRQEGSTTFAVQQSTYKRPVQALESLDQESVSIVQAPASLNNADDVDAIAARYNADVIVWGWCDEMAVRGYVDLANATRADGMTNDLQTFLDRGGSPETMRVLKALSEFDYYEDGPASACQAGSPEM